MTKTKKHKKSKNTLQRLKRLERKVNNTAPEVKQFCRAVNSQAIEYTDPYFGDLQLMGQGDTSATREGDLIKTKSLVIRWRFVYLPNGRDPFSDTDVTNSFRIIVVRYKGTGSNVGANTYPLNVGQGTNVLACWDKEKKRGVYKICYDKVFCIDHYSPNKTGVISIKCGYSPTVWDTAVSTTIPQDGGYAIAVFSDSSVLNPVGFTYVSQLSYIDN